MKHITIFLSLLLFAALTNAQQYEWVKGGGSTRTFYEYRDSETVTAMCTDDNGNVYCLAQLGDLSIKADTFVKSIAQNFRSIVPNKTLLFFSYDCNGTMRFARFIEANDASEAARLEYNAGKVYLAGSMLTNNKIIGGTHYNSTYHVAFLSSFDTSGAMDWVRFVGEDNYNTFNGTIYLSAYVGLAIDSNNNIHRISYMRPGVELSSSYTTSQNGMYDLKYDPSGNLIAVTQLQGVDTNYIIANGEIDPTTNIFYGIFRRPANPPLVNSDNCLMAFDSNGVNLWSKCTGPGSGLYAFHVKPGNSIYLTAIAAVQHFSFAGLTVSNSSPFVSIFGILLNLDLNGNGKWIRGTGSSQSLLRVPDLTLLPDNKIALVGTFSGNLKYQTDSLVSQGLDVDPFLLITDSIGIIIKMDQLSASGYYNDAVVAASDKAGNIYIGGDLEISMGATGLAPYTTHGGNTDFFVMKYGHHCNCTGLPSAAFNFAVNAQNRSASFTFTGTSPADSILWDFGDGGSSRQQNPMHVFPQHGNYTVCATVYTPCGSNKTCQPVSIPVSVRDIAAFQNIRIYPNPTTAQLQIEGLTTHAGYEIHNVLGTTLQKGRLSPGLNTINTQALPTDVYLLQVESNIGEKQVYRISKQ